MIVQKEIVLPPFSRGFHLISELINKHIADIKGKGLLHIFIKHTSAALTINENADYSVRDDFETVFNKLVPENMPYYTHVFEGSDDMPAHIKASIIGSSVSVPVTNSKLNLGTWQGIYLCEFRNAASKRKLVLTFYS